MRVGRSLFLVGAVIYFSYAIVLFNPYEPTFKEMQEQVAEIQKNLTKQIPPQDRSKLNINLIQSPELNAWAGEDGDVYITTALIAALRYDTDAIASILGHEAAHYVLGHGLLAKPDNGKDYPQLISVVVEQTADSFGYALASRAGYDACRGQLTSWQRIAAITGGINIEVSHPSHQKRYNTTMRLCHAEGDDATFMARMWHNPVRWICNLIRGREL